MQLCSILSKAEHLTTLYQSAFVFKTQSQCRWPDVTTYVDTMKLYHYMVNRTPMVELISFGYNLDVYIGSMIAGKAPE